MPASLRVCLTAILQHALPIVRDMLLKNCSHETILLFCHSHGQQCTDTCAVLAVMRMYLCFLGGFWSVMQCCKATTPAAYADSIHNGAQDFEASPYCMTCVQTSTAVHVEWLLGQTTPCCYLQQYACCAAYLKNPELSMTSLLEAGIVPTVVQSYLTYKQWQCDAASRDSTRCNVAHWDVNQRIDCFVFILLDRIVQEQSNNPGQDPTCMEAIKETPVTWATCAADSIMNVRYVLQHSSRIM